MTLFLYILMALSQLDSNKTITSIIGFHQMPYVVSLISAHMTYIYI